MRKLYYSKYVKQIKSIEFSILYHTLTGEFITFRGTDAFSKIDYIMAQYEAGETKYQKTINKLLEKGLVYSTELGKEAEYQHYKTYYIKMNPMLFYCWKDSELVLILQGDVKKNSIRLNSKEIGMWQRLSCKSQRLEAVEEEFLYFNNKFGESKSLFRLCETQEALEECTQFAQLMSDKLVSQKPSMVYLKLTNGCNLNCKMCGQANNKNLYQDHKVQFLDLEVVKKFLNPILDQISYVVLWGGEPLLHRDLLKYIAYFRDNDISVSIATNGTMLEQYAEVIVENGVDEVVISIDGPEVVHNQIRGSKHAFQHTKKGVEALVSSKKDLQRLPNITLNCTITETNEKYLEEVKDLSKEMGVNQLYYQLPIFVTTKQGKTYSDICQQNWQKEARSWEGFDTTYDLGLEQLYKFYVAIKEEKQSNVGFYRTDFKDQEAFNDYFLKPTLALDKSRCITLESAIIIEVNGDVVSCPDFPDICFGNISEHSYEEIINSKVRQSFIEIFKTCGVYPICKRCCQLV